MFGYLAILVLVTAALSAVAGLILSFLVSRLDEDERGDDEPS